MNDGERDLLMKEYEKALEHGNMSKVEECLRLMYESGDTEFTVLLEQSHNRMTPLLEARLIDEEQTERGLQQIAAPGCLNEIEDADTCLECGEPITEGEFCKQCLLSLITTSGEELG